MPETSDVAPVEVPFPDIAQFVRQLAHDVRNGLNAVDLQAAFLAEIATDPEVLEEAKRLRGMVVNTTRMLQGISTYFRPVAASLISYQADMFVEDLLDRLKREYAGKMDAVKWNAGAMPANIEVDLELFTSALKEIFSNAIHFAGKEEGEISFTTRQEAGKTVFELREKKAAVEGDPEDWGRQPFHSTRRGAYGLGLFRARQIVAAHHGRLEIAFAEAQQLLTTTVTIPTTP